MYHESLIRARLEGSFMHVRYSACVIGIALAVAGGCAASSSSAQKEFLSKLSWIRPGVTTRREVLLTLGMPSATYEGGEIVAYRVAIDPDSNVVPATVLHVASDPRLQPWGQYTSLVVVFDGRGVVREHRVIIAEN